MGDRSLVQLDNRSIVEAWKRLDDAFVQLDVSRVDIRRVGDQTVVTIRLRPGVHLPPTKPRAQLAAEWMERHRILDRAQFAAGFGSHSAALHDAAIKRLARAGRIIKDHGIWVWSEQTRRRANRS